MHCSRLFWLWVSTEKSGIILVSFSLDVAFLLSKLSIYFSCYVDLMLKYNMLWGIFFFVLCIWCLVSVWASFLDLGAFSSMILVKIWSKPLTWDYSLLSMSIIQRFGFSWCPVSCVPLVCFAFVCVVFVKYAYSLIIWA